MGIDTMRCNDLRRKIIEFLRDGKLATAKEIAENLSESVYDVGTVIGNMSRRSEVIKSGGARKRWKLYYVRGC